MTDANGKTISAGFSLTDPKGFNILGRGIIRFLNV